MLLGEGLGRRGGERGRWGESRTYSKCEVESYLTDCGTLHKKRNNAKLPLCNARQAHVFSLFTGVKGAREPRGSWGQGRAREGAEWPRVVNHEVESYLTDLESIERKENVHRCVCVYQPHLLARPEVAGVLQRLKYWNRARFKVYGETQNQASYPSSSLCNKKLRLDFPLAFWVNTHLSSPTIRYRPELLTRDDHGNIRRAHVRLRGVGLWDRYPNANSAYRCLPAWVKNVNKGLARAVLGVGVGGSVFEPNEESGRLWSINVSTGLTETSLPRYVVSIASVCALARRSSVPARKEDISASNFAIGLRGSTIGGLGLLCTASPRGFCWEHGTTRWRLDSHKYGSEGMKYNKVTKEFGTGLDMK
ncbi:hypothetical protein DFH06DRAFT_1139217 [Mycena polygramma]|nr:hypothetical protein DFH06DRAFT_1139217 [Mycena polygramma]